MRAYLLFLIIMSMLPVIVAKPFFGVLVYSWFGFMNPHRLTYGFTTNFPFALIIGALTLGAWLISREPKKVPLTPLTLAIFAFVFWINFTTLFAVLPEFALDKLILVAKVLLIAFLTMIMTNTRQRLNVLVWVVVVSIGFYGVKGGLFMILTGGNARVWGPPSSFIADNNALALALIVILPMLRYLHLQAQHIIVRLGLLGAIGLCSLAVLGSYSRGAALAGAIMVALLWLRSRHRLALGAIGAVVLVAGLSFMPAKYFERLETLQSEDDADYALKNPRLVTWELTYRYALTSPIVGGGFSMFNSQEILDQFAPGTKLYNAHSIWFEVLGEHGFVGLGLFILIGVAAVLTCGRVRKRARHRPDMTWAFDMSSMFQVSLIGFAVGGTFLNKAFFDLYWQLLAMIVALSVVAAREFATVPAAPAADSVDDIKPLRPQRSPATKRLAGTAG